MNMLWKRGMILAATILLMVVAAFDVSHYTRHVPAAITQMFLGGIAVKTLSPGKDTEITVTSPNGGTDHLTTKDSEIWCSETSCPDKVCVHQGKKHLNSGTIVCLPNQMIVAITGGE